MTKRLIIFLIRKRLGLNPYQKFRFTNQKTKDTYYFTNDRLMKIVYSDYYVVPSPVSSSVSLNWLLDSRCEVTTML